MSFNTLLENKIGIIWIGYNSLGNTFILTREMRPNQETGSDVHCCRSCLILQNKGAKLALYS